MFSSPLLLSFSPCDPFFGIIGNSNPRLLSPKLILPRNPFFEIFLFFSDLLPPCSLSQQYGGSGIGGTAFLKSILSRYYVPIVPCIASFLPLPCFDLSVPVRVRTSRLILDLMEIFFFPLFWGPYRFPPLLANLLFPGFSFVNSCFSPRNYPFQRPFCSASFPLLARKLPWRVLGLRPSGP